MSFVLRAIPALALMAAVLFAGQADRVAAAEQQSYSAAQVALFATPHLENLSGPTKLRYDMVRKSSLEPPFTDSVELTVTGIAPDGGKNLEFAFLSGERERRFGAIDGFQGNPLVMLFLQWDVEGMSQVLPGSQHYFRNRFRNALVDRAEVEAASVELDGRSLPAQRVSLRPFVGDPQAEHMGAFEQKLYEFVLSPEVPGGIYRIRAFVPGEGGAAPVIEDELTFREQSS